MSNRESSIKSRLFIVMGEEHYTPLGVIRSLGEYGVKPVAIILKNKRTKVASKSKYISKLHMVDSYEEAVDIVLSQYGKIEEKGILIPCDDIAVRACEKRYSELNNLFYVNNAGEDGRIAHFQNKDVLYQLAMKNGIKVAKIWKVNNGEIPSDIEFPVITKPISSYEGWKHDYYVCNSVEELNNAFKKIKAEKVLLQEYIKKKTEMTIEGVSVNKGRDVFFAIQAVYTYILPDYYSMAMIVSNFEDVELGNTLKRMIEEIGYEGIFEIEFMIDENDNKWFLEINYRNSTWSYASTKVGMNLPLLWTYGMIKGHIPKNAKKEVPAGYKAIAEVPDFEHRVRRLKLISFSEWLKEIRKCDCLYFYNKRDMKPFLSVWLYKLKSISRKKLHISDNS